MLKQTFFANSTWIQFNINILQLNKGGMAKKKVVQTLTAEGFDIRITTEGDKDFFNLTDIAKQGSPRPDIIISNWLRNRNTIEFLGLWESLHNPQFNPIGFDGIKTQTGLNTFVLSPKRWIEKTAAIGIRSSSGRYGGTYAHKDIAFEFLSWMSPVFKLYVIKEFQKLKEEEAKQKNLDWDVKRIMAKASYPFQTEAVREHLIPKKLQYTKKEGLFFASEADLLNMALFGTTAKQWKLENATKQGNIRDNATHEQLLVLSVLQGLNAKLIEWGSDSEQRLELLNKAAIEWMFILVNKQSLSQLPGGHSVDKLE